MPRRPPQLLDSSYTMSINNIVKESIGIMLLHPTCFHSISFFLFSPLPLSLFISHFLLHCYPQLPTSAITLADHLLGQQEVLPQLQLLSKTVVHIIICFPSSITFGLLGRAATVQVVSDSYHGIYLDRRRLLMRSGWAWVKLLHTTFWEYLIILGLSGIFLSGLALGSNVLVAYGLCSRMVGFWGVLVLLGVPICLAFAHLMAVGNLARVLAMLKPECCGFESLIKANQLMAGRRQTALAMALLSNTGFRLVEHLLEFRMCKGINLWELPVLVSMYSLMLVFDTVMNAVFYYTCKAEDL
ncbi:hypothetical protein Tsubulata_023350 [Turnera subulata]|uniref:Uncharacterized protein n=1 Tax=Turnera subulata TaxID=218843 RepID=A0A9Q0JCF0_9ROSI|nr:hypothetical protein Tsubulata_023350 [Turnera subulata]